MKERKNLALLLAALGVISCLAGCGSKSASYGMGSASQSAPMMNGSYALTEEAYEADFYGEEAAMDGAPMETSPAAGDTGTAALPQGRKWVITVNLSAETEDLDESLAALEQQIAAVGGYVENQSVNNGSSYSYRRYRSASMTVRVPADQVDSFVKQVSGFTNVVSNSRNVEDITLIYTDTESRVNALRAEEDRLLELMKQAEDMSDLLEIEARLTEVRYDLERNTSQLRRYDNKVDYATVYLDVEEVQRYTPPAEQTFWERISSGISESTEDLADSIVDLVAALIIGLPYILFFALLVVVLVLIVRAFRKRSAAKRAEKLRKWQEQQKTDKKEE